MGYSIQWDNAEKTVILQQYMDKPDKDDLYNLAKESARLLASVSHTVHIIIDEQGNRLNLNAVDIKHLEDLVPINQGVVVVIVRKSDLTYKKFLENAGKKLGPKAFKETAYAATLEEARHFLQEQFVLQYP
ncbi:MAG: hypothetical protein H0X30_17635 [Anaerolineae bacterium]|nr:hypothetical protein [Anaerolineae bacterium]